MTDPWARPSGRDGDGARRHDHVVEVHLAGPDDALRSGATRLVRPEPNWRKVVAISSVAGVVLGLIVAAIVVSGGDDDPDTTPTVDTIDVTSFTTPDTLPPIQPPATTMPEPVPPTAPTGPGAGLDVPPITLPTYAAANLPADILDNFVLDSELLAADPADRVEIDVTPPSGRSTHAVAEHDRLADRYLVAISVPADGGADAPSTVQRILIDVATSALFLDEGDGGWQALPGRRTAMAAADNYRRLMLSPIRSDTLTVATTVAETAVVLDTGRIARRFVVTLPADAIPEWTTATAEPAVSGSDHVVEAYVDEQGRLAVVQGVVVTDGVPQLVVYRFDHSAEVTIGLPDSAPTNASAATVPAAAVPPTVVAPTTAP